MKRIAFIVNPKSGTNNKQKIPQLVNEILNPTLWQSKVVITSSSEEAKNVSSDFVSQGYDAIVAVGGDGTLNVIASTLANTQTALGIIPLGSGNGFARHLKIPRKPSNAIALLNNCEEIKVDYGLANEHFFLSTCGTGFDAAIAKQFANTKKRGFINYLKYIIEDIFKYQPEPYHLRSVDDSSLGLIEHNLGKTIDITNKAFLITFANANQWGYNAQIAPKASVQDGFLDICIMSRYAIFRAPSLSLLLFIKQIHKDIFMQTIRAKDILIERPDATPFHIDGDYVQMPPNIRIRIIEQGIKVLVNKRF